MGFTKSFMMALSSIINNKVRSLLTMLGVIIGIAAVIILVSLMDGVTNALMSIFEDFGTNSLTANIMTRSQTLYVEPREVYKFVDEHEDLYNGMTPLINMSAQIKTPDSGDDTVTTTCTGVSESCRDIQRLDLSFGRFISYSDCENASRFAVIGSYEAVYFFGSCESAIDKTIKINGRPFTVIGVFEESEDSEQSSSDDKVMIPYTTAMSLNGTKRVNTYTVNAADVENIDEAKSQLENFLLEKIGDSDYFNVTSMKSIIDTMTEQIGRMKMMLVAIAGISLLVGGIGIMNIMLVSVTERTREIGIRKSLGARHRHIMTQFVIESGVVSCIGGIIGILLGGTVSVLAGMALDLTVVPSVGAVVLAFSVSVGIGVVFGFLPARKAALLNPIDALRNE